MRKLLVTRESACLQPIRELIEKQKHRTLVMWSIDCAEHILPIFEEKHPHDKRPREAVEAAKAWAHGKIKMPLAKKAAHAAHNAATDVVEADPAACAAARAMGHVVGAVHVETHAIGVVMYGITAFVYAAEQKDAGPRGGGLQLGGRTGRGPRGRSGVRKGPVRGALPPLRDLALGVRPCGLGGACIRGEAAASSLAHVAGSLGSANGNGLLPNFQEAPDFHRRIPGDPQKPPAHNQLQGRAGARLQTASHRRNRQRHHLLA